MPGKPTPLINAKLVLSTLATGYLKVKHTFDTNMTSEIEFTILN